ncbi:hypothetical protein Q8A73_018397 [Channa argus]|nr:hypothetical protein Q8A73_018397 [Channa argus]
MAPEVMLFVWGSGVVPISVKKALLGLIPTRRRTQGSSPQPRPGQPPPPDGTLSSFVRRDPQRGRAAVKAPERQGLEHPHSGVAAHNQTASHKATHTQTTSKTGKRISCLFLLLVTRATLAQSSAPSPPSARLPPCPTRPQDPLDAIQRHIKFIPPQAASQQALDLNWRAPEAKGGVCAKDPPRSGVCLCGVHLNQQGHGPERPLLPFLHHLTTTSDWHGHIHALPLTGVPPPTNLTPEMSFLFQLLPLSSYEWSESHSAPRFPSFSRKTRREETMPG